MSILAVYPHVSHRGPWLAGLYSFDLFIRVITLSITS
jgi:hypothetical protein